MDLNKVLQERLATASLEEVQELLSFNLRRSSAMAELKRTKRFDLLPALLPLLRDRDDKNDEKLHEGFTEIYARLLIDNDEKPANALKASLDLNNRDIATHYGRLVKEDTIVDWAPCDYRNYPEFLEGAIITNKTELFVAVFTRWPAEKQNEERNGLCRSAARYHAMKVIDHLGYDLESLHIYIREVGLDSSFIDACAVCAKPEDLQQALHKYLFWQIRYSGSPSYSYSASRVQHCIEKGWLTLSAEDWSKIAEKAPEFYKELQTDL